MIFVHLNSLPDDAQPAAQAICSTYGWYAAVDLGGKGVTFYTPGHGVESIAYMRALAAQLIEASDAIARGMAAEAAAKGEGVTA